MVKQDRHVRHLPPVVDFICLSRTKFVLSRLVGMSFYFFIEVLLAGSHYSLSHWSHQFLASD
jgi:hypothetical protein